MLIRIRHVTTYRYGAGAQYSIQSLRLTPPNFDGQDLLDWQISAPGIENAATFRDGFGNRVHLAALYQADECVSIEAAGVVETTDTHGVVRGTREFAPVRVFLRHTPTTAIDGPIRALAESAASTDTLECLHGLMRAVHAAVRYEIGATHAHTTAAEALADGRGVCQDHAHVFIAAARCLAIPARYVNGYFLAGGDEPAEAHHAWAEAWVEGIGWVGFDAANAICPTDHYVRLAVGLDAASAAPIRGIRRGGDSETLDVCVEVQQQVTQQ